MPAGALQAAADQAERFDRMKYGEFWPRYLEAHADRRSRALHYLSASAALACIAAAAVAGGWRWLLAGPVGGLRAAWLGPVPGSSEPAGTPMPPSFSLVVGF